MNDPLWLLSATGDKAITFEAGRRLDADMETGVGPIASVSVFEEPAGEGSNGASARLDAVFHGPPPPALAKALNAQGLLVEIGPLPDEDWVAKGLDSLPGVRAGRFHVRGSHIKPRKGGVDLLIEAGEAFGTGHHATTWGCLCALDAVLRAQRVRSVLDLGSGTGLLAIAALKAGAETAVATDLDPDAVRVSAANAKRLGVSTRMEVLHADGFRHPSLRGRVHDLVLANILAGPLLRMAGDIARSVAPAGRAVLSGLMTHQERAVFAAIRSHGLMAEAAWRRDGWSALLLRAPQASNALVARRPRA